MKKFVTLFAAALSLFSGVVLAEVFASRMKVTNPDGSAFDGKVNDGSGARIWYYLNDTATAVTVKVIETGTNAVVATINAVEQGPSANPNSVVWNGTGGATGKKYYYTITTTGRVYSDTKYHPFYFQNTTTVPPLITRGIYTRGFDINTYMNTPGFGYWYASNADPGDNSGYKQGTLRYNPDGSFAGTDPNHPILTQTLGTANGGTFNWGAGTAAAWTAAVDSKGRVYQVSNSGNFVTRMDNDAAVPKVIISNIKAPRGIYPVGEGANLVLYIAADTVVWRAAIGNNDTLTTPLQLIGAFGLYTRDVVIDDAGMMLVTLRTGELTAPGYVERFDISSGLPKKRSDALMTVESALGLPVCFEIKHGTDKNSASDDTIYYAVRRASGTDTTTFGIHQITQIDGFAETKQIYKNSDHPLSGGGNNRQDADIALDWAGNLVWFENANEEIVSIAVPRSGSSVTLMTQSADTIDLSGVTSAGRDGQTAAGFTLHQNFPNPFNPSTMIGYSLPSTAHVSVTVYDLLGNEVKELFRGSAQQGYNAVIWNGTDRSGSTVASGMYLYRVTAVMNDGRVVSDAKRLLLLK